MKITRQRVKELVNKNIGYFSRFLVVGGAASLTYMAVLSFFAGYVQLSTTVSIAIAYMFGTLVSYTGSSKFAFKAEMSKETLTKFLVVKLISFFLNIGIAYLLEQAGVHYFIVGLIIIAFVSLFNFTCHRLWTFKDTVNQS